MNITTAKNRFHILTAAGTAALLTACGGGGSAPSPAQLGTLTVHMTDAPACGFDAVNVTVNKVAVHQSATAPDSDSGWQEITLSPARKINLLDLTNGVLEKLGQTALPAGHYTQVRLILDANAGSGAPANSVVPTGSTSEIALDTPSAAQTGIKLNGSIDVAAGATTDLVLDFDACKSVVTKGNGRYSLKPVISVIAAPATGATFGGITGYVTPGMTSAVVSAQQNGVVIKSTVPDATTGAFTLSPMPASGTASYVVVISADGRTTAAVTGVPVTSGGNTPISTNTAPIAPPTSAMRTVSGAITPVAAQGTVRATQTYGTSGPKIEVAYKAADLTTGAYSMSLPVAAPLIGAFGTLPIALSADATAAAKYGLETKATGFADQAVAIDLGTANVVRDFALTP
jgi:hypothetical protein